jgi:AcrR family transcriptional regulator
VPGSDAIAGKILRAADEVFRESGFERAEMRTIAQRAGIAVGTIYNYFPNKWGLFLRILHDQWEKVQQRVAELRSDPALGWRRQLLGILGALMGYVAENGPIWTEIEAMASSGRKLAAGGDPAALRQVLDWITAQVGEVLAASGQTRWRRAAERERFALVLVAASSALAKRLPRELPDHLRLLESLLPG